MIVVVATLRTSALLCLLAIGNAALAQPSPQCNVFVELREDAQRKALAVRTAVEQKMDRRNVCALVQRYYEAETAVVKFLEDNETFCGIPDKAIAAARDNHDHTSKFLAACREGIDAPSTETPVIGPADRGLRAVISVPMVKQGGVYAVPVLINNAITLDFIVDSGAADVSIPADVVMTLTRTGTLKKEDYLGEKTYVLADGSEVPSQTFRIRSLKVGNKVLHDVNGSIAPVSGSLLLGQSFLGRFKSWSVDNTKHAILLSE